MEPSDEQPTFNEFASSSEPDKPTAGSAPHRRWLLWLIPAALVLAAAGAAAYWWFGRSQAPTTQSTTETKQSEQTAIKPDETTTGTSTTYTSNGKDLNLSFKYLSSWTVAPASNNNSTDNPITITSPLMSMVDASGKSTTARAVVTIRPGGSDIAELASGKATAGQASVQIAYDHPTSVQHQYPNLTYVHLAGGTNPGGAFEEIFITGTMSFLKDQPVLDTSLSALDPIISARFYACSSQDCAVANSPALSITFSAWQNSDLGQQVLAIFQSLQIN